MYIDEMNHQFGISVCVFVSR